MADLGRLAGTELAAFPGMANIIGEAARYTTGQSIRIFQKMLLTTMIVILAIGIFEGVLLSTIVLQWGHMSWALLGLATIGAFAVRQVCLFQHARIARFEKDRNTWRKGTAGERITAGVLESLSDDYWIINDVGTPAGNFDHIVVGPTGAFAIETKNWRGLIAGDGNGELLLNGSPLPVRHVSKFIGRIMGVRETVVALTRRNDLFIKGLMIFPKARVDVRWGQTSSADCLTEESLCAYIENPKFARKLDRNVVDQIVRAFKGIAGMEPDFTETATAAVKRTKSDQVIATVESVR